MLKGTGSPGRAAWPCDGLAASSKGPLANGFAKPCVGTSRQVLSNWRICGVAPKSAAHSVSHVSVFRATPNSDMPSALPSYTVCAGPSTRTVLPSLARSVQADSFPESVTNTKRAEPSNSTTAPLTVALCAVTRKLSDAIGAPLKAVPVALPRLASVASASAPGRNTWPSPSWNSVFSFGSADAVTSPTNCHDVPPPRTQKWPPAPAGRIAIPQASTMSARVNAAPYDALLAARLL